MITQANIWAALKDQANNNIWELVGSGAPTDGTTGANISGPGSIYIDTATGYRYFNSGTLASPVWVTTGAVSPFLLTRSGTIASADITGTSAGQLGHANGYPLVAAPGANKAVWPVLVVASYKFATAAYTGGGTGMSIAWGGGGANLTALVTAANFIAAASDKPVVFLPTTTAVIALVANTSLNMVSQAAPTQPGTAAGVIYWKAIYTIQTLNA